MSDMVPEALNAALDSLFTPKEPGEQEYRGEDGLLYCRICHTPVQCRVKRWGRDKIVPRLCRCQQEAMAEKKRQDDLGIERSTEYALEQVYAVIDERYKSGLPVIITTNLKIAEIRNPQDVAYARIYSRILEMCTPVRISGEDRRKSIGKEKQQVVKEVLDL